MLKLLQAKGDLFISLGANKPGEERGKKKKKDIKDIAYFLFILH